MDKALQGELVESGSFRIDRDRALEKLKDFQLANPRDFHLDLARAGVLSNPSVLKVDRRGRAFVLRFDGAPLSKKTMTDPFSPLFGEAGESTERELCLAYGLLAALRTNPAQITIESGAGKGRVLLQMNSAQGLRQVPAGEDEGETIVTVTGSGRLAAARALREVEQDLGLALPRVIVSGKELGSRPLMRAPNAVMVEDGDLSAVAMPGGTPKEGLLTHYVHGVRAGTPTPYGGKDFAGLSLYAASDSFRLNLSRGAVELSKKAKRGIRALFNGADKRLPLRTRLRWLATGIVATPTVFVLYCWATRYNFGISDVLIFVILNAILAAATQELWLKTVRERR